MSSQFQNDELLVENENSDNEIHSEDEFTEMMSPMESLDTVITNSRYLEIRSKIVRGEFKINNQSGKDRVWAIFGKIDNNLGEEIPNLVVCRICKNIYKYNSSATSNLVRHKCYVALMSCYNEEIVKDIANMITEWVIDNCRSYEIVEDSGFKKVFEFLLSVGEKLERNVELKSLLPHPTTISQNVNKVYNIYFEKIKTELTLIKNIGFGLTACICNDNYLKKTYIALTIHYIHEDNFTSRVLGLKSIEAEKCSNENITLKVSKMLNEYDLEFDDKNIIVTNPDTSMLAAFRKNNHILCINHLLYNALEKSMQEVQNISELSDLCNKLVSHFEITYPDAALISTLKSFPSHHRNKMYNLYVSIERNWSEIVQLLKRKNELIKNINLKHITAIIKVMKPFQESFEKLQADKNATIHLVYAYINRLKKNCRNAKTDFKMIKQLKEKLISYLDSMVLNKLTIYHKIGLFLFPPTNKLIQFSEDEKLLIKDECKRIMKSYHQDIPEINDDNEIVMSGISNDNYELFSDLMDDSESKRFVDKINSEILLYGNKTVKFYDDFNVLHWWNLHKHEFPLLYKVSRKILAIPASSAASDKLFFLARKLISKNEIDIVSSDASMNKIVLLHSNIEKNELQKNLLN